MPNKISVPSIVWQKWHDPFMEDSAPTHLSPEDFIEEPEYIDDVNEIKKNENYPTEYEDAEGDETENKEVHKKHFKAIITPFGIMPYDEYNSIGRSFNFWIGHTNFDITNNIVDIIELASGVETLDVFTRYRFRIGIAQLFTSADVMSDITNGVYKYLDKYGQ